jgi:hypothetical protein
MLCLAGLQKTAVSQSYVVKKLQPSAFFWTMQFVPQYVYEETSSGADPHSPRASILLSGR